MSALITAKSLLAKLLAEENITVEHRPVATAFFDLEKRLLVCPNWNDLTSFEYDLLLGHEVSHARNTPKEGWHHTIAEDKKRPNLRRFLNVIEDARIERIIKDRYPGLRASFFTAYRSFHKDRDFFGVKDCDLDNLLFIDRINLFFKIGAWLNIKWKNAQEERFISRIRDARTFEDVSTIAREVYDYCKAEKKQQKEEQEQEQVKVKSQNKDDIFDDSEYDFEEVDKSENMSADGFSGNEPGNDETDNDEETQSLSNGSGDAEPDSLTDYNYHSNLNSLHGQNSRNNNYYTFPKFDSTVGRIINYKDLYENYSNEGSWKHFFQTVLPNRATQVDVEFNIESVMTRLFNNFHNTHGKYVNYLVKQFELRKRAKQYARASTAKTGELDMKKVHKYQLVEDLFKKVTVLPNEKNHGLFMVIDSSGSMRDVYANTREQVCILAMFCKKVGIPFEVYEFVDNKSVPYTEEDLKGKAVGNMVVPGNATTYVEYGEHYEYNGARRIKNFRMQQILSSSMNTREFNRYLKYNLYVATSMRIRTRCDTAIEGLTRNEEVVMSHFFPMCEELNGTPLDQTLILSLDLVPEFKKKHNISVVNFIVLTDGDGDYPAYHQPSSASSWYQQDNRFIIDPVTKVSYKVPGVGYAISCTHTYLKMLQERYDVRVIGFYLAGDTPHRRLTSMVQNHSEKNDKKISRNDVASLVDVLKKQKYVTLNDYMGFEKYFFVPMNDDAFQTTDLNKFLSNPSTSTKNATIKTAFRKMQKNKQLNVKFLNHFMEQIV